MRLSFTTHRGETPRLGFTGYADSASAEESGAIGAVDGHSTCRAHGEVATLRGPGVRGRRGRVPSGTCGSRGRRVPRQGRTYARRARIGLQVGGATATGAIRFRPPIYIPFPWSTRLIRRFSSSSTACIVLCPTRKGRRCTFIETLQALKRCPTRKRPGTTRVACSSLPAPSGWLRTARAA